MDTVGASPLIDKVLQFSDLELAMLLCLMADQHCIIQSEQGAIGTLEHELQLIASNVFGLYHTVVHCDKSTTLDDFSSGILVDWSEGEDQLAEVGDGMKADENRESTLPTSTAQDPSHKSTSGRRQQRIANVIIVAGLNQADELIQIQALELLRTRRIFTHTEIHTAPKAFVFINLYSTEDASLNNHIFISHFHDHDDGYSNLEAAQDPKDGETTSLSSVVHRSSISISSTPPSNVPFPTQDVKTLTDLSRHVKITAEVQAYLHNLVVFLRLHRAVAKGATPTATTYFGLLSRIMTTIHSQSFTTPAIVGLAFRKIYRHRIKITAPDFERSIQYGSDQNAVSAMLKGYTPEMILEDVLREVEVPV